MANPQDDSLHIPGHDKAAKAREKIAALSDAHLENDHPLLRTHKSTELKEPKLTPTELAMQGKMTSPAKHHHGLPAELVANKRKIRPLPSKTRPIVSAVASFLLLMLIFKSEVVISQIKYLTSKTQVVEDTKPADSGPKVAAAPIIQIPKIKVKAPVVYEASTSESQIQKSLQHGVVHYGNTAKPGEPGNAVIVGHSSNDWWQPGKYKFVFVLLDKMVPGDRFSVNYNSKRYVYEVTRTKVVSPTDLSVLTQTAEPTMTLITCTPPGTNWRRLIVQAKQISPSPTKLAGTPKTIDTKIGSLPSNAPDFIDQIWHFITGLLDKLADALS